MDEKILQLRVGIFVLLAIIILLALIYLNSEIWKGQYTIYLKPQTAPAVKENTPIRKNGILIGRVRSIQTRDDHVTLELRIDNDERVYENEVATIGTESILGDAVIEIMPMPVDRRGRVLGNDDLIKTVAIRRNPMEIVDVALNLEGQIADTLVSIKQTADTFEQTAGQVGSAGDDVARLTRTIQDVFDNDDSELKKLIADFREVSKKSRIALDNFNRIFENIDEVIGDPAFKDQFNDAFASIPNLFDEVSSAVSDIRETVTSFQRISDSGYKNLQNIEGFTDSLNVNGPEILQQVNSQLENVDILVSELKKAAESIGKISSSEGTVGKLLNETELYDTVLQTVANVRDETYKLEPLMNDIRLLVDGISRDPGQLGLRGALRNKSPLGTGYKGSTTGRGRVIRR